MFLFASSTMLYMLKHIETNQKIKYHQFFSLTYESMLTPAEEIGCLLPRDINTNLDASPTLLSAGLLTPKVPL